MSAGRPSTPIDPLRQALACGWRGAVRGWKRTRARHRQAVRERTSWLALYQLDARALADIGITPADIPRLEPHGRAWFAPRCERMADRPGTAVPPALRRSVATGIFAAIVATCLTLTTFAGIAVADRSYSAARSSAAA